MIEPVGARAVLRPRPDRHAPRAGRRGIRAPAAGTRLPRYAVLLRLQARGLPSVASPLAGTTVHWTVVFLRLAHARPLQACSVRVAGLLKSNFASTDRPSALLSVR